MMTKVLGIECGSSLDVLEIPFSTKYDLEVGDKVIFKDPEGREEFGVVEYVDRSARDDEGVLRDSKILRRATPNDLQKVLNHSELGVVALEKAKELVSKLEMEMSVFRAAYSFDGSKIHFLFTSDDRVDFRELVKELAKSLKKQIHLRQIGPRDKARLTGGYGRCGRSLCCTAWLSDLGGIGMEMVRTQALEGKGSSKLSGSCGKLLCCLRYEIEAYRALKKSLPGLGSKVKVVGRDGAAIVLALDILNQKLKVSFEKGEICTIPATDVKEVLSIKKANI